MHDHNLYMQRCLELAGMGRGYTSPNPMVGAVLVYEDKIIGEGYHEKFGEPHAEVNAINAVVPEWKPYIENATLYVSLEPCVHHGKTPPCTELILEKKIKQVVIACLDPNPLVSGKGKQRLEANGVEVIEGIMENESRELNKFFITYQEKKRPYIILKWAQSRDSFTAAEDYKAVHFTNSFSDQLVHKMRSECMAIFAGGRTIVSDNPALSVRYWTGPDPVKVSLDTKNDFYKTLKIFNSPSIIFNFEKSAQNGHTEFIRIDGNGNIQQQMLNALYERKINSMLIEGGTTTIQSFVNANLWDEAKIFTTPVELKNGIRSPEIPGEIISRQDIFGDILITARRDR